MNQCVFWADKHAVLNAEQKMEILPAKRCDKKQFKGYLFCQSHVKETKNFMPSRIYEMAAKSMREEIDKKRGKK